MRKARIAAGEAPTAIPAESSLLATDTGPITIAHDYFTQRGGAERVAAALIEALQPDRVVTAMHAPDRTFPLAHEGRLNTTFLQRVRFFRTDPRRALPAFPAAWRTMKPVREGLVICSSSGWAHSIRTRRNVMKIVYCHNPARWLYQPDDYLPEQSSPVKLAMRILRPALQRWDLRAARSADAYIANSSAVAKRIKQAYGIEPTVIHPPISLDTKGPLEDIAGIEPGFFLTVGRGRGYKNVDKLVDAIGRLDDERLVVVGSSGPSGPMRANVRFLTGVTDAQLRWLYANARALLSVSHEDFGLTPLEANAFGTPALVLRAGGFLDSLREDVSGRFIDTATVDAIAAAARSFPTAWDAEAIRRHADQFSMNAFLHKFDRVIADAAGRRKR